MKLYVNKVGEGKPVIIIHGLFGMSDNWMSISKQLAEKGFCCFVVDLRNHGRSPHSMEFNYELMAEDIAELMLDNDIPFADIIGHSMGGKAAMFFARAYPEKVRKMIVVDIAPRYYPPHHQTILAALKSFNPAELSNRREAEEILRVSIKEESTLQFLLKNLYWKEMSNNGQTTASTPLSTSKDEGGGSKESVLAWRFGLEELDGNIDEVGKEFISEEEIKTDILFIRGERSGYIGEDDIRSIKTIFPFAKIETIAGAGHWVHAEKPGEFFRSCFAFLNDH